MSDLNLDFVKVIHEMNAKTARSKAWPELHGAILPSVQFTLPDGTRVASAGNALWKFPQDETWHGYIYDLLRTQLGVEWFAAELAKSADEQHILAKWYTEVCQRELDEKQRFTQWTPEQDIGATMAYRSVAYDAWCLMQAMSLTAKLLARLRHPDQFEGARYELWVAATLARAGYSLELLNEDDRRSRHGELIATHQKTGEKFWVEAKRRKRDIGKVIAGQGSQKADVQGLVSDAMGKPAEHPRIIFIDVNLPPSPGGIVQAPWVRQFRTSINKLELQPQFRGKLDMRAFIMATNHPYHYTSATTPDPKQHFIGTAFNMRDLDLKTLDKSHPTIIELMQSITQHFAIPDQFLE